MCACAFYASALLRPPPPPRPISNAKGGFFRPFAAAFRHSNGQNMNESRGGPWVVVFAFSCFWPGVAIRGMGVFCAAGLASGVIPWEEIVVTIHWSSKITIRESPFSFTTCFWEVPSLLLSGDCFLVAGFISYLKLIAANSFLLF
eukprot:gene7390-5203_t